MSYLPPFFFSHLGRPNCQALPFSYYLTQPWRKLLEGTRTLGKEVELVKVRFSDVRAGTMEPHSTE
jgi:hypothetical protein